MHKDATNCCSAVSTRCLHVSSLLTFLNSMYFKKKKKKKNNVTVKYVGERYPVRCQLCCFLTKPNNLRLNLLNLSLRGSAINLKYSILTLFILYICDSDLLEDCMF